MESEVRSHLVRPLPQRFGLFTRLSVSHNTRLTLCMLVGFGLAGCSSESSQTPAFDGSIMGEFEMSVSENREVSVATTDAGVINSCPEDTEESCETAVFSECTPREGSNGATLIRGTVILEDSIICDGDVLIDRTSRLVICVGEDCSSEALAGEATVVCADVVLPGLIDPHNHMSYNTLPPWRAGGRLFQNRNQWRSQLGPELYDARPPRNDAIAARYSELRLILSGTTSVHKAEDTRSSHAHVRNIDRADDAHGLGYGDSAFRECVFPFTSSCSDQPDYAENQDIPERAFVAHVAEGIDEDSRSEFDEFSTNDRLGSKTSIIHCVACTGDQLSEMKATNTKLIWSPQSNIGLYGLTTNVATAVRMNMTVALGPDWTPSGTMNMLTEAKCAKQVSDDYWNGVVSDKRIVQMMTSNAAKSLGVFDQIGSIVPGKLADILLLSGDRRNPYDAVVEANTTDVRGVFIDGARQMGDQDIYNTDIARNEFCEVISMCEIDKIICVKDVAGEPNRFDRSDWARFGFYDVVNYVETLVQNQKPAGISPDLEYAYVAHPLCECVPTFDCALGNATVSGERGSDDRDGDGVGNASDNCPETFNPQQSNIDGDETGDACDPCPWAFPDCPCAVPSGPDRDGDGVLDEVDNCPATSNPEQTDRDDDMVGDECDLCPDTPISSMQGCPVSIARIKRGEVPTDAFVETEGTVTGVYGQHLDDGSVGSFFIQTGDTDIGYDGLFVYMGNRAGTVEVPDVGSRIKVSGIVSDFFGQLQLSNITQVQTETRSVILPTDEVLSRLDGREREVESQLICLFDLTVSNVAPEPGPGDSAPSYEFVVEDEDAAYSIIVNDALYRPAQMPTLGTYFERICGVYHVANGAYKIEPRDQSDFDTGPSRVIGVGPTNSFIRTNEKRIPTNESGRKLTVELSEIAPEGGLVVFIETEENTIGRLPESLRVPAGIKRFPIVAESFDTVGTVNFTIRSEGDESILPAQFSVLSANAHPESASLVSQSDSVLEGQEVQIRLTVDQPATQTMRFALISSDPDAVQVPGAVTIQRNESQVTFSMRTLTVQEDLILQAKSGRLRATLTLDIIGVQPSPIITELNADMAGVETLEFVELYNPSRLPITTANLAVVLINGGSGEPYETYDLSTPELSWAPDSFLVIGDPSVAALVPADTLFIPWESSGSDHDIQNGNPDGVRLELNGVSIDSLSYGGLIENVTEGVSGAPDDLNTEASTTISRCPYNLDTNENQADFKLAPASPGQVNDCIETEMP